MIVGRAPPLALIIEETPGVETQIASDRAHVAMGRAGNAGRGLRQHGVMPHHLGMRGDLGERDGRADLDPLRVGMDGPELLHVGDVDEAFRGDDATPDVHEEIGAAAEQPPVGVIPAQFQNFIQRVGRRSWKSASATSEI